MDVLVPHAAGIAALADVPGVRAIRYSPEAPLPAEAEGAEVLVAPFNATVVPQRFTTPAVRSTGAPTRRCAGDMAGAVIPSDATPCPHM